MVERYLVNLVNLEKNTKFYFIFKIILRLNEGFASWVEILGMNKTHPEWRDVKNYRNLFI